MSFSYSEIQEMVAEVMEESFPNGQMSPVLALKTVSCLMWYEVLGIQPNDKGKLLDLLGVSRGYFYTYTKKYPSFPPPVSLTSKRIGWIAGDVYQFILLLRMESRQ